MGPASFLPAAPLTLRGMARKPVSAVKKKNVLPNDVFLLSGQPADLRNSELRTRENRGMSVPCSTFRIQIINAQSNLCAVPSVAICRYETNVKV
jgi:hypothetical protein